MTTLLGFDGPDEHVGVRVVRERVLRDERGLTVARGGRTADRAREDDQRAGDGSVRRARRNIGPGSSNEVDGCPAGRLRASIWADWAETPADAQDRATDECARGRGISFAGARSSRIVRSRISPADAVPASRRSARALGICRNASGSSGRQNRQRRRASAHGLFARSPRKPYSARTCAGSRPIDGHSDHVVRRRRSAASGGSTCPSAGSGRATRGRGRRATGGRAPPGRASPRRTPRTPAGPGGSLSAGTPNARPIGRVSP
jgi:hypothetical protein